MIDPTAEAAIDDLLEMIDYMLQHNTRKLPNRMKSRLEEIRVAHGGGDDDPLE